MTKKTISEQPNEIFYMVLCFVGILIALSSTGCSKRPDWSFTSSGEGTVSCSCTPTGPVRDGRVNYASEAPAAPTTQLQDAGPQLDLHTQQFKYPNAYDYEEPEAGPAHRSSPSEVSGE